jgi:regulator of protease activity HflC (stomatin/prohibitin superfamily)
MVTFEIIAGLIIGIGIYLIGRGILTGFYTVAPNERAVLTSFGRAHRVRGQTVLDTPLADSLSEGDRQRYNYPLLEIIPPGGPYFCWPWQKVHKVNIAIATASIAYDPDSPEANQGGIVLDAVTQDQLNIGVTGQLRFGVCEGNLYAFLFGVKSPISHVMGYFVSILRERIATFRALQAHTPGSPEQLDVHFEGISINDLRKNLNLLNEQMDAECRSSAARYGIQLDASLITGIDPPSQIESALAAINTAHNEVSSELSIAQALADQRIEESKKAVEIQTMRAEAEVEPLRWLAEQLRLLRQSGPEAIPGYLRNVKLELFHRVRQVFLPFKP